VKSQFFGQNSTGWSLDSRYRYQSSKGCKVPKKTEESVAGAGIVTTPCKKARLFFLSTEYYLEGAAVVNTIAVIRARLNGNYPFLPAVWNSNGRLKPNVALVNGKNQKAELISTMGFTVSPAAVASR
jgi:hypothetical protein